MTQSESGALVLVIDDDPVMRLSCSKILEKSSYRVATFADGESGLEAAKTMDPDLVLVDLRMRGIGGIEVISAIHDLDPRIVLVVITGYATIQNAVEATKAGAYDFVPKPFSPEELRLVVGRGLERRQLLFETHRLELEREYLKRHFLTFVAHQLRSPLAAIHQYLGVMKRFGDSPEDREKRRQWTDRCLRRSDELMALIRDWLTLSRVESGCLGGPAGPVDLAPLVREILESYENLAAEKRVTLNADIPSEGCVVRGDRTCLGVLIDNLVINAITYNRPGGEVRVSARPSDANVELEVADTGVGIPPAALPTLFEEFSRIRSRAEGGPQGSGLGLAICKRIAKELGAAIEVESQENVGSIFRVLFPAMERTDEVVAVEATA